MKIGAGWTKTKKETNETYISICLDEVFGVIFPPLRFIIKDCFLTLRHIPQSDRKSENSPGWSLNITIKKDKDKNQNVSESEELISEEEIPF